LRMQKYVFILK